MSQSASIVHGPTVASWWPYSVPVEVQAIITAPGPCAPRSPWGPRHAGSAAEHGSPWAPGEPAGPWGSCPSLKSVASSDLSFTFGLLTAFGAMFLPLTLL